tara:strand:- start:1111 stop:1560 length:450 start_codon:yes stop_codon:yes gene_type:complete
MPKRGRDGGVLCMRPPKSARTFTQTLDLARGTKRALDFNEEVEMARKRLRATVPSPEEAIAFILPHLVELQRLYKQEQETCAALKKHVQMAETRNQELLNNLTTAIVQRDAAQKACDAAQESSGQLKRHLEMAQYRLALLDRETFSHLM